MAPREKEENEDGGRSKKFAKGISKLLRRDGLRGDHAEDEGGEEDRSSV
jgi:hypothetical protein